MENAHCSNGLLHRTSSARGQRSVISLLGGRLAVCECSNLKRIEHQACEHGGSGFGAMVREVVSC